MTKLTHLVFFTLALWPLDASAEPHRRRAFSADAAQAGVLLLQAQTDESTWLAPQVSNEVELRVTGMIARARVAQVFENPSDEVVEAVYVFPLPETAAVDGLTLVIGERKIVGEIRERGEARQTFEQAKAEGKKASLLEQERPNLFTTRVANIGPGEVVQVALSYQQDVLYDAGRFSLLFPATLTPRYIPGNAGAELQGLLGTGWGTNTPAVPDAERITPPVVLEDGPSLDMTVTIDAGFPLEHLTSPSHAIDVVPTAAPAPVTVTLRHGGQLADRDFRLEWQPKPDRAPRSALFEEEYKGKRYAMLMLLPPDAGLDRDGRIGRESIFVIDTSGSMSGTSIEQARAALETGLAKLQPADHFNVIEFNSTAQRLFHTPKPANRDNIDKALGWVRRLAADGGTEMLSALSLAFEGQKTAERLQQVIFITDGSVGNESELLRYIHGHLGQQRLFTVGIGSAPNHYFMRGAARFGRGTFTHVADAGEVSTVMNGLWKRLDAPLMSDLELTWVDGPKSETWPERLPDLYRGEPLVVLTKLDKASSAARLVGRRSSGEVSTQLALGRGTGGGLSRQSAAERGLHRLWARRKIEGLMDRMIEGTSEEEVRPLVTALALEHHLMSKYTSLVAVDKARSVEAPGRAVAVANALPAGNTMFGNLPQTATPGPTCLLLSILSFAGAWSLLKRGGA